MKYKYLFIITTSILTIIILNGYFFNYINDNFFHYENNEENGLTNLSLPIKYVIIVVIAPLIETFIFQMIPSIVLNMLKIESKYLLIIIPSLLFSLGHIYNPIYMCMTFIGGVFLNIYYYESKKYNHHYFFLTALIHSFYNLYGMLFT